mmetsp:Transcript_38540/g.120654  ORF Transcript_38540/g.120654 Transcript_38540/m.120654 type:complete len:259 (-) Transcript_38540:475-1251(-)
MRSCMMNMSGTVRAAAMRKRPRRKSTWRSSRSPPSSLPPSLSTQRLGVYDMSSTMAKMSRGPNSGDGWYSTATRLRAMLTFTLATAGSFPTTSMMRVGQASQVMPVTLSTSVSRGRRCPPPPPDSTSSGSTPGPLRSSPEVVLTTWASKPATSISSTILRARSSWPAASPVTVLTSTRPLMTLTRASSTPSVRSAARCTVEAQLAQVIPSTCSTTSADWALPRGAAPLASPAAPPRPAAAPAPPRGAIVFASLSPTTR